MASTPRQQYERERNRLDDAKDDGRISAAEYDAVTTFLDARDESCVGTPARGIKTTDSGHSLRSYANTARKTAERLDDDLTDTTAAAINQLMSDHLTGRHPDVKDDGLSERTISSYQGVVRKFYEYHDFGVAPEDIEIVNPGQSPVDERKMFTDDEIEAMRDEIDNPRDRCLFELLLNTGQRIGAIQSLRVKDVAPEDGVFWLNPEGGLKGADKNGRKRPLLGAQRPVHDWLKDHPTNDPEDYLITNLPTWSRGPNAGEMLSQQSLNRILKSIGERAGVPDEKLHAHNFRHNFVTIAKRDYGLDNDTIKHLIGHAPDSSVMETTYAHLTDDDYIQAAEEGAGIREPESDSPLTPAICPTCGDQLPDGAKACSGCGNVFAPDAQATKEQIQDDVKRSYAETDPEDSERMDQLDSIDDVLADPEAKAALLDELEDDLRERLRAD